MPDPAEWAADNCIRFADTASGKSVWNMEPITAGPVDLERFADRLKFHAQAAVARGVISPARLRKMVGNPFEDA